MSLTATPLMFGTRRAAAAAPTAGAAAQDRPKAEFWVNFGQLAEVTTSEGTTVEFISLPWGIALDTMEKTPLGRSEKYNFMVQAGNDLLDQLLAYARTLEPGQVIYGDTTGGLTWQLRRVKAVEEPKKGANPYAVKLNIMPVGAE